MGKNNIKDSRSLHCYSCGIHLTTKNKTKGEHANECKLCSNTRKLAERKARQLRYKWEAVQLLGGRCESCNKEVTLETMVCFDFHHKVETKRDGGDNTIANIIANARPLKVVLEEAEKCILFCACCHRLHHQKYGY